MTKKFIRHRSPKTNYPDMSDVNQMICLMENVPKQFHQSDANKWRGFTKVWAEVNQDWEFECTRQVQMGRTLKVQIGRTLKVQIGRTLEVQMGRTLKVQMGRTLKVLWANTVQHTNERTNQTNVKPRPFARSQNPNPTFFLERTIFFMNNVHDHDKLLLINCCFCVVPQRSFCVCAQPIRDDVPM